jgi:hypothetical protein
MISGSTSGQKYLIKLGKTLGYEPNEAGLCQGISMKGMEAFLIGEYDVFEKRRIMIQDLWKFCKGDKQTINEIIKAAESIRDNARKTGTPITQTIDVINNKNQVIKFDPEELTFIQHFFDAVDIYQEPDLYQHLFDSTSQGTPSQRQVELIAPLVMSKALQDQGGFVSPPDWRWLGGMFDEDKMNKYCKLLDTMANEFEQDITFYLGSKIHASSLLYSSKDKTWILLDPENIPAKRFTSANLSELAKGLMLALRVDKQATRVAFESRVFCTENTKKDNALLVAFLKQSEEFQELCGIDREKANLTTPDGESYIQLAASFNCVTELKRLIALEVDINQQNSFGKTPLYQAAYWGNLESVKILINAKANLDLASHNGTTPLHIAAKNGRNEIVQELLRAGANKTLADNNGKTPAMLAAKNGNLEILKIFANYGVNLLATGADSKLILVQEAQLERALIEASIKADSPAHFISRQKEKIANLDKVINYINKLHNIASLVPPPPPSDPKKNAEKAAFIAKQKAPTTKAANSFSFASGKHTLLPPPPTKKSPRKVVTDAENDAAFAVIAERKKAR